MLVLAALTVACTDRFSAPSSAADGGGEPPPFDDSGDRRAGFGLLLVAEAHPGVVGDPTVFNERHRASP